VARSAAPEWHLVGFIEHLDRWAALESPNQDRRLVVAQWVIARHDDPYAGVRREPGFDNLWFGRIPGTRDAANTVVTCSYFVEESTNTVTCNSIASLSLPA